MQTVLNCTVTCGYVARLDCDSRNFLSRISRPNSFRVPANIRTAENFKALSLCPKTPAGASINCICRSGTIGQSITAWQNSKAGVLELCHVVLCASDIPEVRRIPVARAHTRKLALRLLLSRFFSFSLAASLIVAPPIPL